MTQHQGRAASPFIQAPDPRLLELDAELRTLDREGHSIWQSAQDPFLANQLERHRLGRAGEWSMGTIIHAIPHLGWYRVQLTPRHSIGACAIQDCGLNPAGVRLIGSLPAASTVLVFKPPGFSFAYIVGVIPQPLVNGRLGCPDWLLQGSPAGLKREAAHSFPVSLGRLGGVRDMSGNQPQDSHSMVRGFMADTGVAALVAPGWFALRVHEMCGIFGSLFDGLLAVRGQQLKLETAASEDHRGIDEGETYGERATATYPWEALGRYAPGAGLVQTYSDAEVQYTQPVGKVDLPLAAADVEPIFRSREYAGYAGQGRLWTVGCPAPGGSGTRRRSGEDQDEGLFLESVGLNGALHVQSAKSIGLVKRSGVPQPRRRKLREEAGGDDLRTGNYRFSGQFGDGPAHTPSELQWPAGEPDYRRAAAVDDVIAQSIWHAMHPFVHHAGDYQTPQDGEGILPVSSPLDFSVLQNQAAVPPPTPTRLRIDHRHEADYYPNEAGLLILDEGTVILFDGYGSAQVMTGGHIFTSSPGDQVDLCGRTRAVLCGQFVSNSRGSTDLTAGRDLRLKASVNMQLVAAVNGEGSLLLESQSEGDTQQFEKKVGEDVRGSGVLIRSAGILGLVGASAYVRSEGGDIVVDAEGEGQVTFHSTRVDLYANTVQIHHGTLGAEAEITAGHLFTASRTLLAGTLNVGAGLQTGEGDVLIAGSVRANGNIESGGRIADRTGGTLGEVSSNYAGSLASRLEVAAQQHEDAAAEGQLRHGQIFTEGLYAVEQLGNDRLLEAAHFSYRDDLVLQQYGTAVFAFPEPRWQQLVRTGQASGGQPWQETPVSYQGRDLYPWPGAVNWTSRPVFLQHRPVLHDPERGVAVTRPYPLAVSMADWDRVTFGDGLMYVHI